MTPRKHAELIKAWADGAEIQYCRMDGEWGDVDIPLWSESSEYRLKPVPKADHTIEGTIYLVSAPWTCRVKVTFSGETGEAKKAEIVK